jgi:hypothetical protein
LVTKDGVVTVPPSYLGADDGARFGNELRLRYMVPYEYLHGRRTAATPSFEIWLHTPLSNVDYARVHTRPLRPLGVVLAIFGSVLGAASLSLLAAGNHDNRTAGAAVLGGLSVAFGGGGTLLLVLPETTSPLDLQR